MDFTKYMYCIFILLKVKSYFQNTTFRLLFKKEAIFIVSAQKPKPAIVINNDTYMYKYSYKQTE